MSPPSAYQCLFCNHLNPAGASFCNECGSQLQLQQCDLCGSINKRSARVCYKCGAAFTFPSQLGTNAAMLEHRSTSEDPDHEAIEHEHTTLPESVVEALSAKRADPENAGVRTSGRRSYDSGAPSDAAEAVDDHAAAAASPDTGGASAIAPVASRFNHRHALALTVLVMLLVVVLMYFARGSLGPAAPGAIAKVGSDSVATRAPQASSTAAAVDVVGRSAPRAPAADELGASAVAPPAVANSEGGEAEGNRAVRREPVGKACQAAVAALGLCDVAPNQEKP